MPFNLCAKREVDHGSCPGLPDDVFEYSSPTFRLKFNCEEIFVGALYYGDLGGGGAKNAPSLTTKCLPMTDC